VPTRASLDIYEGLSSEVALPNQIEVVVHEILGHVASCEGVVAAIREIKTRPNLIKPSCVFVPRAAGTFLAPSWAFSPSVLERLLLFSVQGSMDRPEGMYHAIGFPESLLIAPAQPMEWWDFSEELHPKQRRVLCFEVDRPGCFEGLHLHMKAELDQHVSINTYTSPTTWSCTWIRLWAAGNGVHVVPGCRIEVICEVDVGSHRPLYAIEVGVADSAVSPVRQVATFSWSGDG